MEQNKNSLIEAYLKSVNLLIVDQNSTARVGLKKILISLGAELHQVFLAASVQEAEDYIQIKKPSLVFCDYQIGDKFGLDLLQKQREEHPKELNHSIFILVTSNTSQSAVAQAAEEDIDAYILKPFTIENFTLSLARAIQIKTQPPAYLQLINQGKILLENEKLDDAMTIFKTAITKDSTPSLAYFYEGLTEFKKNYLDDSKSSYEKGLSFNKIHYKCLVGLFDLLMILKKYDNAYEVVNRIIKFFPANPKRLATVLKLAIQTQHFNDIESFYQEFLKIENRNEELTKSVCAALIVCGKKFFEISNFNSGNDLIQKASVTSAGNTFILRKAIETLVLYGQTTEAKNILKRFPIHTNEDINFAIASLWISSKHSKPETVASRGEELIRKGFNEPDIFQITIDSLKKCGLNERAYELKEKAVSLFPELSHEFKNAA